jgi:clathrin heavy chain
LLVQLQALEKEVKERAQKESQKEQQDAEAPIINPGGFGDRLLLTQGNGCVVRYLHRPTAHVLRRFVGQPPPMPNGTGMGMRSSVSIFPSTEPCA